MADLDEDEYDALLEAVRARQRADSWTNTHEQLASVVEALWAVLARLDAGLAVVQVEKVDRPKEPKRYPRPDHLTDGDYTTAADSGDVVVVTSVRDALALMGKGGGGPA